MVGKGASYKEFGLESHLISPILIRVQGTDQHKMLSKHTAFARCAKRSRGIIPMRGDADERAAASRIFEAVLEPGKMATSLRVPMPTAAARPSISSSVERGLIRGTLTFGLGGEKQRRARREYRTGWKPAYSVGPLFHQTCYSTASADKSPSERASPRRRRATVKSPFPPSLFPRLGSCTSLIGRHPGQSRVDQPPRYPKRGKATQQWARSGTERRNKEGSFNVRRRCVDQTSYVLMILCLNLLLEVISFLEAADKQ